VKVIEVAEAMIGFWGCEGSGRDLARKMKRWTGELPELYKNEHSWAGDQGCIGFLVRKDGSVTTLSYGGWYSENGRITRNDPDVDPHEALAEAGASAGDVLVIEKWNRYNNPLCEFEDYYYHGITDQDIARGKEKLEAIGQTDV